MNKTVLRWWVVACFSFVIMAVAKYKGLFSALWAADISGLSSVIISVYFVATFFVGVLTSRLTKNEPGSPVFQNNSRYLQGCWFTTEMLMALGMMGTLIGFMIMLGPALATIDIANLATAKTGIFEMAAGMSTAITTTLVGLITSQLLKLQLINLEISLEGREKNEN